MVIRRIVLVLLVLTALVPVAWGQRPETQKRARKTSVMLLGGLGWPVAKESLTDFWRYGPQGMVAFLTPVGRNLSLGAGVDISILRFSYAGFHSKHPNLWPPNRKVTWMDLFLLGKYELTPAKRLTPYLSLSIGATRLTPASFVRTVDSVRVTYFEIHPRSRLSAGIAGGIDFEVTRMVAFLAEVNAVLVYNDPEAGMRVSLRCGFSVTW